MKITVEVPDEVLLCAGAGREVFEAFVIEAYRTGPISHSEASHLLGISRDQFDGMLKERHIEEHAYSMESLEADAMAIRVERNGSFAA